MVILLLYKLYILQYKLNYLTIIIIQPFIVAFLGGPFFCRQVFIFNKGLLIKNMDANSHSTTNREVMSNQTCSLCRGRSKDLRINLGGYFTGIYCSLITQSSPQELNCNEKKRLNYQKLISRYASTIRPLKWFSIGRL